MTLRSVRCFFCGDMTDKKVSHINRAAKLGASLYCSHACAASARRIETTPEHRKEAKRIYDAARRVEKAAEIKAKKAAAYQRNRDPVKEAEARKARMPQHVAYCRTPEYRAWKAAYDKRKRFEAYGPFEEAARLLEELEHEISTRATRYEIYIANGRFTRSAQKRRRELWQSIRRY